MVILSRHNLYHLAKKNSALLKYLIKSTPYAVSQVNKLYIVKEQITQKQGKIPFGAVIFKGVRYHVIHLQGKISCISQ